MQSTVSRQTAKALAASNRFLEIANRHNRMTPLLEAFVVEVKSLTGCEAVVIRILQENGSMPYESYDGFKQEFYDLENHLSIWFDRCACINIVKGDVDPQLPFYTPEGSFYIIRFDEFFCKLSPEERGMFRGNCHKFGYESMALVPIRLGGQILGMIHAADHRKDFMPLAMVELLERVGLQLGPAIHRIKVEEECRQAENALRGQQEELEIILDTVPAMIFYKDKENRFIRVNKALASAMGLPKEEINGKSVYELLPSHANEYWKDDWEVISSGNPKHNIVEPLETPEGVRWVQTDKIPYRDNQGNIIGVIGFAVDITERKQAEEALRESEERYRSIFQESHAVMLLIDPETGAIIDANPAASSYYGYPKEELTAKLITDINIIPADQTLVEMQRARSGECRQFMFQHRLADGNVQDVEVFSGPIHFHGKILLYSIVHDISARKAAEKALRDRTAELEFANKEMESFAYSVSHDLKAPVRATQGFSRMLKLEHADRLDSEGLRLLKVVTDNTKLMHHLIDDLPALSRLGRLEIRKGSVNLTSMARRGVGYDERYADKLFNAFQRLHRREEYEGTGVGLAIVKRIIERHGGRVWAEGKVNKGATFYFALPKNGESPFSGGWTK